mmetsp:Transcript_54652/g.97170  ORF Transcript_54652/g.97170 Transcript_54652/m.97170 type:complete len:295 (-) Transcript_54652:1082-1966(-)
MQIIPALNLGSAYLLRAHWKGYWLGVLAQVKGLNTAGAGSNIRCQLSPGGIPVGQHTLLEGKLKWGQTRSGTEAGLRASQVRKGLDQGTLFGVYVRGASIVLHLMIALVGGASPWIIILIVDQDTEDGQHVDEGAIEQPQLEHHILGHLPHLGLLREGDEPQHHTTQHSPDTAGSFRGEGACGKQHALHPPASKGLDLVCRIGDHGVQCYARDGVTASHEHEGGCNEVEAGFRLVGGGPAQQAQTDACGRCNRVYGQCGHDEGPLVVMPREPRSHCERHRNAYACRQELQPNLL